MSAPAQSKTNERHGSRRLHPRRSKVGQTAMPFAMLNEATNPDVMTIRHAFKDRGHSVPVAGNQRHASSVPPIASEFSQTNPPQVVMLALPIQKLPTIRARVAASLAVKSTVVSRQRGTSSRIAVPNRSTIHTNENSRWTPRKKRTQANRLR